MYKTISATSLELLRLTLKPAAPSGAAGAAVGSTAIAGAAAAKTAAAAATAVNSSLVGAPGSVAYGVEPKAEAGTATGQNEDGRSHSADNGGRFGEYVNGTDNVVAMRPYISLPEWDMNGPSVRTSSEGNVGQRHNSTSPAPVTIDDIYVELPGFARALNIEDFFASEDFFATNLANITDTLINHGRASESILCPVSKSFFTALPASKQTALIYMAKQLVLKLLNLKTLIQDFNVTFNEKYEKILTEVRLAILLNVKALYHLENSRAMAVALCKFKALFENLNFDGLHEVLNEINDLIFDYNEHVDLLESKYGTSETNQAPSEDGAASSGAASSSANALANYSMLNRLSFQVDSLLHRQSEFVTKDCANYKNRIQKIMVAYTDFFNKFKKAVRESNNNRHALFEYEIILFDDHLKNQL